MAVARVKFIGIRETLTSLLPKAEIERLARESGAMRRRRKVDPSAMFWCVVLGFGTGSERTLAGLRRSYEVLICIGIHTGMRRSGITSLLWQRVDLERHWCSDSEVVDQETRG